MYRARAFFKHCKYTCACVIPIYYDQKRSVTREPLSVRVPPPSPSAHALPSQQGLFSNWWWWCRSKLPEQSLFLRSCRCCIWPSSKQKLGKVFNDPIHGHIELHPVMVKVIDTPQFQRLRHIKQLSASYYVFPGASHNRFEHSIGVGYLAGELVETLQRKQPELKITDKEVLCVKLAGLCHDLGHGPFSHLFQEFVKESATDEVNKEWKHEYASIMMFRHLIVANELEGFMKENGLKDHHMKLIEDLIIEDVPENIKAKLPKCKWSGSSYDAKGREFLFEIVANENTGIDVDKMDYFARDCQYLGLPNNFDIKRYMHFVRVLECPDGKKRICTREKEVFNLYEMFHTRAALYRRAYTHKTKDGIDLMIKKAMILANGCEEFKKKIGEAIWDPEKYTELTDQVLQQIQFSDSTESSIKEAQDILKRIENRELYKCIGYFTKDDSKKKEQQWDAKNVKKYLETQPEMENMPVALATFHYGMKKEDPLKEMYYYKKDKPDDAFPVRKDQLPKMLPETFMEEQIRVYCEKEKYEKEKDFYLDWLKKIGEEKGYKFIVSGADAT